MSIPTKLWTARNLIERENSIEVRYREVGRPIQVAICGSEKSYRTLSAKLRRQGYVHLSQLMK